MAVVPFRTITMRDLDALHVRAEQLKREIELLVRLTREEVALSRELVQRLRAVNITPTPKAIRRVKELRESRQQV
jgi:hypothetical protein